MPTPTFDAYLFNRMSRFRNAMNTTMGVPLRRTARPGGIYRPSGITGLARRVRPRTALRSGVGVTVQHDKQSVYRKKSMPRKLKRRFRKFTRKVHAVAEKDLGTRTVVYNTLCQHSSQDNNADSVTSISLYGQKSSSNLHNDLNGIMQLENRLDPTAAAGATVDRMSKYLFQSAVLDLTFRNASTVRLGDVQVPASEAIQELDIYEIYCSKDFATSGTNYNDLGGAIDNEINQEKVLGGSGTNIRLVRRGVCPFDCPTALSRLGIKILKKTKYFIPQGSCITYQVRDPKRRVALNRTLSDEEGANCVRWTKWLLLNFKLAPGLVLGANEGEYTCNARIGVTRKYMYKVEGLPENRNEYFANTQTLGNPS